MPGKATSSFSCSLAHMGCVQTKEKYPQGFALDNQACGFLVPAKGIHVRGTMRGWWEGGRKELDAKEQHQLAVNMKKIGLATHGQLTMWMEDLDLQIPKAERVVGIS